MPLGHGLGLRGDDRKLFIAVGQGLQGVLTDALASQIIRNQIRPYFRNEQYA